MPEEITKNKIIILLAIIIILILAILLILWLGQIKEKKLINEAPLAKEVTKRLKGTEYLPPTESKCQAKINEAEKTACFNLLYRNQAIAAKDPQLCQKIVNDLKYKNECLQHIAEQLQDEKICEQIYQEDMKEGCYNQIAFLTDDLSMCDKYDVDFQKRECAGAIKAYQYAAQNNLEACKTINTLEYNNLCFSLIVNQHENCDFFEKQADKDLCQSMTSYNLALAAKNKELCNNIPLENYKKVCLNIFKNPSSDSDNDGLSDSEELWIGTDPFKADTDGDGLTDGDEMDKYHTDPQKFDTDGDGVSDGDEVKAGTDPLNPLSK